MPKPSLARVEALFHQAVEQTPANRVAFLEVACAGDGDLRAAVEDLLRCDDETAGLPSFLVSPVARPADLASSDPLTIPAMLGSGLDSSRGSLPFLPGYEVIEEIGRGGMGVVYKAQQRGLHRLVALKMVLSSHALSPEQLTRFRTEAEALARLHHPNIVQVYDIGEHEGWPYFAMEYVAGPSLVRLLEGQPQDPRRAARLIEILARAVHAVHQCGLIHRDLKPANILLTAKEPGPGTRDQTWMNQDPGQGNGPSLVSLSAYEPKITDFGLAKDQTSEQRLTQSGITMGTPCYMAPEQCTAGAPSAPRWTSMPWAPFSSNC